MGKERGADPDNLTNREKTILVKGRQCRTMASPRGVCSPGVGLARSTYYHQLNAMNRPDRDEGLLALGARRVREQPAPLRLPAGCGSN